MEANRVALSLNCFAFRELLVSLSPLSLTRARKEGRGSLHAFGLGPLRARRKMGGVWPIFRTFFSLTQEQAVANST